MVLNTLEDGELRDDNNTMTITILIDTSLLQWKFILIYTPIVSYGQIYVRQTEAKSRISKKNLKKETHGKHMENQKANQRNPKNTRTKKKAKKGRQKTKNDKTKQQ